LVLVSYSIIFLSTGIYSVMVSGCKFAKSLSEVYY
jgi:hypothetical protein